MFNCVHKGLCTVIDWKFKVPRAEIIGNKEDIDELNDAHLVEEFTLFPGSHSQSVLSFKRTSGKGLTVLMVAEETEGWRKGLTVRLEIVCPRKTSNYEVPLAYILPRGQSEAWFEFAIALSEEQLMPWLGPDEATQLHLRCTIQGVSGTSLPYDSTSKSQMFYEMSQMLENEVGADVTLIAEKKELKVCKAILSARSKVFAALFGNGMTETSKKEVELKEIKFESLRTLVKFLYTASVDLPDTETALEMLVVADKYDVRSLFDVCHFKVANELSDENVIESLLIAERHNCKDLLETAKEYALKKSPGELEKLKGWEDVCDTFKVKLMKALAMKFANKLRNATKKRKLTK